MHLSREPDGMDTTAGWKSTGHDTEAKTESETDNDNEYSIIYNTSFINYLIVHHATQQNGSYKACA